MKRMNRLSRSRPQQARKADIPAAEERVLEISAVGSRGDSTAEGEAGPIYTPYALPGEQVRARVAGGRAELLEVLRASPERQAPACRHFGRCGGCQLQHWADEPYLAWKREQVVEALNKRGFGGVQVKPTIAAWGEGRRRAAVHAARQNNQVRIGFIERGGARLTPITQCPVLAPQLEATVLKLGSLAELTLPARGEITMQCLLTDSGVDISIKGAGRVDLLNRAHGRLRG